MKRMPSEVRGSPEVVRALLMFILHADHEQRSTNVLRGVGSSRADP